MLFLHTGMKESDEILHTRKLLLKKTQTFEVGLSEESVHRSLLCLWFVHGCGDKEFRFR